MRFRPTIVYAATRVVVAFSCATNLPVNSYAQSNISVSGVIIDDSTGHPIDQVTIRIEGSAYESVSRSDGAFEFRAVPTGTWVIVLERAGYHSRRIESIDVVEGFSRHLHLTLDPDPIALSPLEVSAQHPADFDGVRRLDVAANRHSARTVGELLETIPGVRVYGASDAPGGTRISVGGEPADRVAILLDGLPLSGGADGAVDLSAIPIGAITAIEVHPGSQTVMAGDAAVGGAVNLITRASTNKRETRLTSSAGEWGHLRQEVTTSHRIGTAKASLGGELDRRGSRYNFRDINTDTSGVRRNAAIDERRLFLRLEDAPVRGIDLLAYGSRHERGAPGTVERPMNAFTRNKNARVQSQRESQVGKRYRLDLAAWYEFGSEYYNASGERIPNHSYIREHFVGARFGQEFETGIGSIHNEIETRYRLLHGEDFQRPKFSFGDRERAEYALRSKWGHRLGRLSASAGLAVDLDKENAPGWSPRVDLHWRPIDAVGLRAGWGQSFRRPLLMSAFWKGDYYTQGNPDLLPERASEWDVGIRWRSRIATLNSRYFERTIDDIIVWDLRGIPQKYQPVNLAAARVIGREDQATLSTPGGQFTLDYTHVFSDAVDRSGEANYEGRTLVFSPRHTHDLTFRASQGPVAVRLNGRWVTRRYTLRANTKWQSPYRAFDAEVRLIPVQSRPHVAVFMRADNITNEAIELLQGYPSPARTITVGFNLGIP